MNLRIFALLALLGLLALFTTPTEACKCIAKKGGKPKDSATWKACRRAKGKMIGNDCNAHSMSERMANFHRVCEERGARSDCRCSFGCRAADEDSGTKEVEIETEGDIYGEGIGGDDAAKA